VIWRLATIYPDLKAAVPCYGSNPPLDDAANIRAAVLGVYADLDARITPARFELEERLQSAGVTYRFKVYPNSQHAFFNNTGAAYNPDTAAELWMDTLNWFAEYLDLPSPVVEPNMA
jgi:carboxymethylenebutenolidase